VSLLLTAGVIALTWVYVGQFGITAPVREMWIYDLPVVIGMLDGTVTFAEVTKPKDVHLHLLPMLVVMLNVWIDPSWNIATQLYITLMLYTTTWLLTTAVYWRSNNSLWVYAVPLLALTVLSLRQHTNLVWSYAALAWGMQLMWVAVIAWGLAFVRQGIPLLLWVVVGTIAANLTSAAGMVMIIALTLVLPFYGLRWPLYAVWVIFVVAMGVFYVQVVFPGTTTETILAENRVLRTITFFISAVSAVFFPRPWLYPTMFYVTVTLGALIWVGLLTVWHLRRGTWRMLLPWYFLILYGLGTAAQLATSRAGLMWGGTASRYVTLVLPFWMGLVGLVLLSLPMRVPLRRLQVGLLVLLAVALVRVNVLAFTVDNKPQLLGYYTDELAHQCLWAFQVSRGETCFNTFEPKGIGALRPAVDTLFERRLALYREFDGYNPATVTMPTPYRAGEPLFISGPQPQQHVVDLRAVDFLGRAVPIPAGAIYRVIGSDVTPVAPTLAASGTLMTPQIFDADQLRVRLALVDRLWYLRGHDETDFDAAIRDVLAEQFTPVPIAGGAFNTTVYEDITLYLRQPDPQIVFGDTVTLETWQLASPFTLTACEPVLLDVLWRAQTDLDVTLSVSVVLVSADGQAAARRDGAPGGYQTQLWQADMFYRGREEIDTCGLAPGTYPLVLGLYPAGDPQAIPALAPDGPPLGEQVYLTTITIE